MEGIEKCIEKRNNLRNVQRKRKVGAVLNNYRKIFREYADVIRGHHVFLFDLDQTLLDFHASEYKGLKIVVEAEGYEFNDDLYGYFKARNKELWLELEKGTISRTDLFKTRFRLLFEKCGADTAEEAEGKHQGFTGLYRYQRGTGKCRRKGAVNRTRPVY